MHRPGGRELRPLDRDSGAVRVMFKDKKWVIPSHNDYPADAKDRLSKTAAAVMDLDKDTIRSDGVKEQESMGVIDPLDAKVRTCGAGQAGNLARHVGESAGGFHHRQ